jgi:hypothetical protein
LRRDDLFLADIVAAADAIAAFIAGRAETELVNDDLLRSAVLQKLTVIGEAAARRAPAKRPEPGQRTTPVIPPIAIRPVVLSICYHAVSWRIAVVPKRLIWAATCCL